MLHCMDVGRVLTGKRYSGRGRYGMVSWCGGGSYVSMFRRASKILLGNIFYASLIWLSVVALLRV